MDTYKSTFDQLGRLRPSPRQRARRAALTPWLATIAAVAAWALLTAALEGLV